MIWRKRRRRNNKRGLAGRPTVNAISDYRNLMKRPFIKEIIKIISFIAIIISLGGFYFTYKYYVPVHYYSLHDTKYIESKNVYIFRFVMDSLTISMYIGNFVLLKRAIEKNRIFIWLYSFTGLIGIISFFVIGYYAKSIVLIDVIKGLRIFGEGLLLNAFLLYLYEREQKTFSLSKKNS